MNSPGNPVAAAYAVLAISALGLSYPYLIYPLLLAMVSRFRTHAGAPSTDAPAVAILVSAFNEESRIADKIANFEALDYPRHRLEMWIGTDGSTDRTAEVIRNLGAHRVNLVERRERSGKTAVLNDLASRAKADVFVFTDVNALFRPDAVTQLTAMLAGPPVGLVSGRTVILAGDGNVAVEGAYYRFESWLKSMEGRCGWLPGADGAIYALKAALYRPLPEELINDLVHPCQVVERGFEARFAATAVSEEAAGEGTEREFHRQTRITAQAAFLLAGQTPALLQRWKWGMLWVLLSHKWLRWIAAIWMITGALALGVAAPWLAAIGVGLIAILIAGWIAGAGFAAMPVFFLLIHFAYLRGLWHAVKGERYVTWKPRSG